MGLFKVDMNDKVIFPTVNVNVNHSENEMVTIHEPLIESIDPHAFDGLNKLTDLSIYQNSIPLYEGMFKELSNLNELRIEYCRFESIEANVFSGLKKLKLLYSRCDGIKHFHKDVFKDLDNLTVLEIESEDGEINQLAPHLFNGLSKLLTLELNNNNIEHLKKDSFIKLNNLTYLGLSDNCISSIEPYAFNGLVNLEILALRCNDIKHLNKNTFIGLNNSSKIDLRNNKIETIDSLNHFVMIGNFHIIRD